MDYTIIGQRIRARRRQLNMSQEQLAEKVWISTTHMSHIEKGSTKLSLPVLVDLAKALDLSVTEILEGEDEHGSSSCARMCRLLASCSQAQAKVICDIAEAAKLAMDKYSENK